MKYTTEQITELLKQLGLLPNWEGIKETPVDADDLIEELTALCNKVRYDTLIGAADYLVRCGYLTAAGCAIELRRMAEEVMK